MNRIALILAVLLAVPFLFSAIVIQNPGGGGPDCGGYSSPALLGKETFEATATNACDAGYTDSANWTEGTVTTDCNHTAVALSGTYSGEMIATGSGFASAWRLLSTGGEVGTMYAAAIYRITNDTSGNDIMLEFLRSGGGPDSVAYLFANDDGNFYINADVCGASDTGVAYAIDTDYYIKIKWVTGATNSSVFSAWITTDLVAGWGSEHSLTSCETKDIDQIAIGRGLASNFTVVVDEVTIDEEDISVCEVNPS